MNYNQSIVKNLLKSTLESECLKLLSELKLVHSADRLFHIFTTAGQRSRNTRKLNTTVMFIHRCACLHAVVVKGNAMLQEFRTASQLCWSTENAAPKNSVC